ncbi:hypothetical protein XENTR_v10022753 [Xenopus tropicalis]|nr:hypothetical protein XENTR_v10022753 [Xenopus tropicalis]
MYTKCITYQYIPPQISLFPIYCPLQETAAQRAARLPLIHSASQILSFAYQDVKNLHPMVRYVCGLSERGVKLASRVALAGASPVLNRMKAPISVVNKVALRVVDELQVQLPVLDQPADEVVADLRDQLTGAVGGARDQVVNALQNAQDGAKGLLTEAQDAALLAATMLGSLGIGETLRLGAERVVSQAETLVDTYLPGEEDEYEAEAGESSTSTFSIDI